MRRIYLAKLP